MGEIAKAMILIGVVLVVTGLVVLLFQKANFPGKLPGDILIKRENFTFYFPLATCIIISIVISLILYLLGKFR
jgi:uncharacterized protein HemY